eukprot:COSAG04_NODE_968_length_9110_cov_6.799911_2_plen_108_part_00
MHVTVEFGLYHPCVQRVHDAAPSPAKVFVIDPGLHVMQSETWSLPYSATYRLAGQPMQSNTELVLYRPRAQRVHDTAPSPCKVSVIDPAWHTRQSTFESVPYLPAEH